MKKYRDRGQKSQTFLVFKYDLVKHYFKEQ